VFDFLRPFDKIVVTGPQRSGTTICAQMIAQDLGYQYVDEWDYDALGTSFVSLVMTGSRLVVQAPAVMQCIWLLPLEQVAVVLMRRDMAGIIASEERVGSTYDMQERAKFGWSRRPSREIKYMYWERVLKLLCPHAFEIEYESLAQHSLWVPPEQRLDFTIKQTAVEGA
jgi:hypothetical protein